MKIAYYNRNLRCGYSLDIVHKTLVRALVREFPVKESDIKEYYMPMSRAYPWHCIINIAYTLFYRRKCTINHQTGDNHYLLLGLIGSKCVVTIHDLVSLERTRNRLKWMYKYLFYLYFPVKIADKIVCISNQTKNDVLKYINTEKITVIYNPVNPAYKHIPKTFNKDNPIILHIGTGWNKNLDRVIMALKGLNCRLRIIGEVSEEQMNLLNDCEIDYSAGIDLSDEQIIKEYQKCDVVSFPSVYEGFGMPIVEGQKTGRIVVTSHIEPLLEISGRAAILVNPKDIESMRKGFKQAIENDSLREQLIAKGLMNAAKFNCRDVAAQYMHLYNNL